MWNKIKEFFKKFWGLIFIPLGIFIVNLFFKDNSSEIKKEIKEEKKEIKEDTKQVVKKEEAVEKTEEKVIKINEETKGVIEDNLDDKEARDEKASSFFPGL